MQDEKKSSLLIFTFIVIVSAYFVDITSLFEGMHAIISLPDGNTNMLDKFGIKKIYPTKDSGRECYINMDDPKSDGLFFITSDHKIKRQDDGTWQINNTEVRLNVDTPPNVEPWKNVEITGYDRVVETISPSKSTDDNESSADDYGFSWRGRSGEHSIDNPCEGTSYIAILDTNGTVG